LHCRQQRRLAAVARRLAAVTPAALAWAVSLPGCAPLSLEAPLQQQKEVLLLVVVVLLLLLLLGVVQQESRCCRRYMQYC
jgi:hypothetical protein